MQGVQPIRQSIRGSECRLSGKESMVVECRLSGKESMVVRANYLVKNLWQ